MHLGAFSVSLSVKDLSVSQAFYAKLGFAVVAGDVRQNWLILRNPDEVTIGLFQGQIERNCLTFNPGWSRRCENLDGFTDVRELQALIKSHGIKPDVCVSADSPSGPAYFTLTDPDGNPILIDQHR